MTVFDATMFDLMRLALTRDFFRLVGKVGDKDRSILPKDYSGFQSWEQVRDSIIEGWLKYRYLKDILSFLEEQKVACIDPTSQPNYGHLMELVLRRNIHIHNRGIVDSYYLSDGSRHGTGQYSNLSLGDTAGIDNTYWVSAGQLCTSCIDRVAAWVDTLPTLPASPTTGMGV